jgi:hypothetical protein
MPRKRFKIYPALPLNSQREEKPTLDPSKAPWSSPRGFATSIPEEVDAWKRMIRAQNPPSKPLPVIRKEPKHKKKYSFSCKNILKKPFVAIYNHFQAITFSEKRHEDMNTRAHRFIGFVCCIRADVNEAISS